jgi:hypothetical protein
MLEIQVSIIKLMREHIAKGVMQILLRKAGRLKENGFSQLEKIGLFLGLSPITWK